MAVKWGVLGTAGIARWATIPGMKKSKNCELYAIAGRDEKKVDAYKKEFGFEKGYVGYDALLADPDVQAVYIPLPNHIHCEWVIKALEAKKHVLCEKPLAMNADEVQKMFDAAKKNGVILMEAYAYLHSPYVESLKKDVQSGIIGNVDFIDTAFVTQGYKEDFRLHKEFGGGAMYDLGCYCTTMILSLINSDVTEIHASADIKNGVDYLTVAGLNFANGARASFTVGMALGANTNGRYDRLYIHGTKGSIISAVEYNQEGKLSYTISAEGKSIIRNIDAPQNYALELDQLNACILNGDSPHITEEFSLKNMRLIDRVLKEIGY
ncbi:MAG: Gfo/Idh/MocA family oxidoreductase [Treponema sp.]|jgi:predicted dehydrogenase|nr:Gfo/Idh/MocA family oxidoreductase [Treponema sp.]MBQ1644932.1 Gfo/Idh/MocA family oxidoreductase [Treponema sp.]MBQ1713929.1 Gfo/Idh/MocA family oxidoreductase [Treponema sp.]MBQ2356576.1 Gfo/Idh/MocA family oxidoreductase [Treponema sp.]MBQ2547742.1 Gfo/Idh/MocA family oxidoreductase [Treponema sp.]